MTKINFFPTLALTLALLINSQQQAQVSTTLNDFFLPGSQPNQSGSFNSMPNNCGCHGGYDIAVEPMHNWRGSMMSQAQRDPLYLAALTIANQDAEFSGDLCIRCHSPRGWLSGRSTPTDGSSLTADDREGVYCEFCHRAVKPSQIGVNPYPNNLEYTNNTYPADQTYLAQLTQTNNLPDSSANGMYLIDEDDTRRGPYTESDAQATHSERYSPFHREALMCATCHDVSNPAFTKQTDGTYTLNDLDTPSPSFNPYEMFPIERTFSEWLMSEYNSATGVYAPKFGGNKNYVSTCQDCHLRDVTGKGCDKQQAPVRTDLGLHDMTGGNTFIPTLLSSLYPGEVDEAALVSGITRATYMLQNAATLEYEEPIFQTDGILLRVKVTNETGHKLPSGYPEGRRIWLNVKAYDDDARQNLIFESGAYDNSTGVLTHDDQVKIYEIKPGNNTIPTFHFVLNNKIHKDNRIPPRGFTNANFETIQSPPVDYTYTDGQYWDYTEYLLPSTTRYFVVNLYYQTTSKEYVEFLRDENVTDTRGQTMYDLWNTHGKSAPVLMNSISNPSPLPVELVSFTAEVKNLSVLLKWKTESEVNNYGFDVERSVEGGKWMKVGFVQGSGNSNSPKKYFYTDTNPIGGQAFKYRLKQIDTDGSYEYSSFLEVELVLSEFTLYQNYPNPFNPITTINYSIPKQSIVIINVFDILGNEIKTLVNEEKSAGSYEVEFIAEGLSSGVYYYQLKADSFVETKKMILMK